jgi:hypothetical protein
LVGAIQLMGLGGIGREIGGSVILTLKWFSIIYNIA